ncbi:MAG: hypothetical protein C4519_12775 [Desulfobacteraceae bacterium]|nr:MAG: hypothetical protein C4519_12775 [Desulfobacteraceae bacterium]
MKTIILTAAWVMTFLIGAAGVSAETRYPYYGVADGAFVNEPAEGVERVEMADGNYITFPLSNEKTALLPNRERLERAGSKEIQGGGTLRAEDAETEVIEMADGNMIAFTKEKEVVQVGLNPLDCMNLNKC